MRIGIIIRCCRSVGSSRYVIETSKHFAEKNEVHIFTNNWDPLDKRIKIHRIPSFSLGPKDSVSNIYVRETTFALASTFTLKFKQFDVTLSQPTRYFSPDVAEMQFVYKAWADYKRKNKIKILLGDRMLPLIERYNIKKAKKVIAISNVVKNEVTSNYNIPDEKIDVIHSGVDLDVFNPKQKASDYIRRKHDIGDDELVLLFVGNPFVRKGLMPLTDALSKLKNNNLRLLILGKDDTQYMFERYAEKRGVRDKMIFAGLSNEVYKYFAAGDIFVFPTHYEPFGLVILEAMASGLPVITSQNAGAAEIIDDGKDGLWINDSNDPNEIAEKINYLTENDELRKQMGKKARKKAENYSWENTAKKMLKTLEGAANIKVDGRLM